MQILHDVRSPTHLIVFFFVFLIVFLFWTNNASVNFPPFLFPIHNCSMQMLRVLVSSTGVGVAFPGPLPHTIRPHVPLHLAPKRSPSPSASPCHYPLVRATVLSHLDDFSSLSAPLWAPVFAPHTSTIHSAARG